MATSAEIQAKIDKLEINMDRLDRIVNSDENTDVVVDSGIVPSISKFYSEIFLNVEDITEEIQVLADNAAASAAIASASAIPSIVTYSGSDNNNVNNITALNSATSALKSGTFLRFPHKQNEGIYKFNSEPNFGNLVITPDYGVKFNTVSMPSATAKFSNPIEFTFSSINSSYVVPSKFKAPAADKTAFLRGGDIDDTQLSFISPNAGGLDYAAVVYPTGDTWTTDTPGSTDATGVYYNLTNDGIVHAAFRSAIPGKEVSFSFPAGSAYARMIVIRGTNGTDFFTVTQDGSTTFVRKQKTLAATSPTSVNWQGKSTHNTYNMAFAEITIRVISQNKYTILVNGTDVLFGIDTLSTIGQIEYVGGGGYGLSAGPIAMQVYGWKEREDGVFGGTQPFTFTVIGDSRSEDLHGAWPYHCRDYLDSAFGMRCTGIDNRAIGGDTSAQQLSIIVPTAWQASTAVSLGTRRSNNGSMYQVVTAGTTAASGGPTGTANSINDGTAVWKYLCPAGVGTSVIAVVSLGTNDIQGNASISVATYINNLTSIFNALTNANIKIVFVVPALWYGQGQTPSGTAGLNTGGYGDGTIYRLAAEKLCFQRGIRVVNNLETYGQVLGTFLNGDIVSIDPTLRDNIHQTAMRYRMDGYEIARAIASEIVPRKKVKIDSQSISTSWIQSSWTATSQIPRFSRDSNFNVNLVGVLDRGAAAWGDGVLTLMLPKFLAPTVIKRIPISFYNGTTYKTAMAQIGTDGSLRFYGLESTTVWVSIDFTYNIR